MYFLTLQSVLEAVAQTRSVKKVFLKMSQNSPEDACARVSILIKLQAWGAHFGTGVFLWILRNFSEYLFLQNTEHLQVAASGVSF